MGYTFKQQLCPTNKCSIKCPYTMNAEYITVHNTANDASAKSEITYMLSNNNCTSFHVAVDDIEVIQAISFNRNAFHAGDGNGRGNRTSIGIEICYSKSGGTRFDKAEENAAKYIAQLLAERKWGIERVRTHQSWSGKYCPHRTLDKGWQRFLNMVKAELDKLNAPVIPKLNANGIYVQSNDNMGIVAGLVTDTQDKANTEYSWYYTIDCVNYVEIKGWNNGEWITWKPDEYGDYILIAKARYKGSKEEVSSFVTVKYHPYIKGDFHDIIDSKFMLGVEVYVNDGCEAEIQLYDCTQQAWIYGTGKCIIDDTSLWTTIEPIKNNAYWALFRVYKDNILVDEQCCGFVV